MNGNQYVDVRGPHPVYINGINAIELRGENRTIIVEEAYVVAQAMQRESESDNSISDAAKEKIHSAYVDLVDYWLDKVQSISYHNQEFAASQLAYCNKMLAFYADNLS